MMERADVMRREDLGKLLLRSANRDMRKLLTLRKELTATKPGTVQHRSLTVQLTDLAERVASVRPMIESRRAARDN